MKKPKHQNVFLDVLHSPKGLTTAKDIQDAAMLYLNQGKPAVAKLAFIFTPTSKVKGRIEYHIEMRVAVEQLKIHAPDKEPARADEEKEGKTA